MTILRLLYAERVVSFDLSTDKTRLEAEECCDYYFRQKLTKGQVRDLIAELQALHDQMVEP